MNWDDVYLVSENLNTATDAEVDELEKLISAKVPEDYREFVIKLGEGNYCDYVSIHHPRSRYADWQSYIAQMGGYLKTDLLSIEQWKNSLQIANTPDGDWLYIHDGEVYLHPRSGAIRNLGSSFFTALEWMLLKDPDFNQPLYNQSQYIEVKHRWFESWVNRISNHYELPVTKSVTADKLHEKILSLNLHQYLKKSTTYLGFYVKEIYGLVHIHAHHGGFASITYDVEMENEHYQRLVTTLEELGFVLTDYKKLTPEYYSAIEY